MGMVTEVFNEFLLLEPGKKIMIKMPDEKRLNSIRTLLYRENQHYYNKTGNQTNMVCAKVKEADGFYLEVKNEPIAYVVVEDNQ